MYLKKDTYHYCHAWLMVSVMLALFCLPVKAQQLPVYSQYMMNRFLINPARAGAYGYTTVEVNAREQWLGFRGSPKTHSVAFQTRLLKQSYMSGGTTVRRRYAAKKRSGRVAVGGYVFNDRAGLLNYNGAQLSYAYHIRMQQQQLSFGLSTSLIQMNIDKDKIILFPGEESDPLLGTSQLVSYAPDATFGVYYVFPGFYVGLSASQLTQSSLLFGNVNYQNFRLLRTYHLMSGYMFELDRYFAVEPSFLYKTNEKLRNQLDISARAFYMKDYWVGMSYRTGGRAVEGAKNAGAFIIMAGVGIDIVQIGYAFDYSFNSMQRYTYGSHELNIAVNFGSSAQRYRWIKRF